MATMNKRLVLASRPTGEPTPQNFRLEQVALPTLKDGEVLVQHHYLSLDPYMRGRMNEGKSYAQPQPLDAVMIGGTVGEVVESRHAGFKAGDKVVGMGGWQQYAVVGRGQPGVLRKVDASRVPLSAFLGAVGMPGVTAWVGLTRSSRPRRARPSSSAPRAARSAAWSASSPRPAAAVRWASPAAPTSAPTWCASSASTPASTTSSSTA